MFKSYSVRLLRKKEEGDLMKFYTFKLPRFIGGFVRVIIGTFKKD
ncbi:MULTISPECIES: stage V sporulation protein SpoVM [Terribacillus]